MKLTQILLASTLAAAAATSFAASKDKQETPEQEKVVVNTQEQPATETTAIDGATPAQPTVEAAAESSALAQPTQ